MSGGPLDLVEALVDTEQFPQFLPLASIQSVAMQDVRTEPSGKSGSTSTSSQPKGVWIRLVQLSAWLALIGYAALLLQRAQIRHRLTADEPGMQLADLMRIRDWAIDLTVMSVKVGVCFGLLGFLVAVALTEENRPPRWVARLRRLFVGVLPGAGLLVLLASIETGRLPSLASAVVPMVGYLIGTWIGQTAWHGPWALIRLVPTFALLALLPTTAIVAIGVLAVEGEPFAFEPPPVTSSEKHRLAEILTKPRRLDDGSRGLRLSEKDVNLMLTMAVAQVLSEAKGRVDLERDTVVCDLSVPASTSVPASRYVNVHIEWHVGMEDARPAIRLNQCRVGRLTVPTPILEMGMKQAQAIVANDADLQRILSAVASLRVEPEAVEAVLVSRGVVSDVLPSLLARLGRNPNVASKAREYYRHLVSKAEEMPKDERFERLVAAAFQLARSRSQQGDPVLENRAAVLTLAILLGHSRVEHLVGPVTDPELRLEARRQARGVTLRGRADWCQHFFVSAALAIVSNERLTDQAGLLKEEADSVQGGSGFSFSDLLADRAGTRFAVAATRDEQAARRIQERLADGFDLGEIFPEAADLPEGISEARLESEYGGVGGEKYEAMIAEIERRLAGCEGLR